MDGYDEWMMDEWMMDEWMGMMIDGWMIYGRLNEPFSLIKTYPRLSEQNVS